MIQDIKDIFQSIELSHEQESTQTLYNKLLKQIDGLGGEFAEKLKMLSAVSDAVDDAVSLEDLQYRLTEWGNLAYVLQDTIVTAQKLLDYLSLEKKYFVAERYSQSYEHYCNFIDTETKKRTSKGAAPSAFQKISAANVDSSMIALFGPTLKEKEKEIIQVENLLKNLKEKFDILKNVLISNCAIAKLKNN